VTSRLASLGGRTNASAPTFVSALLRCCNLIRQRETETMPTLISQPTRIQAAGNKPKIIDEYIGRVNSKTSAASVAHMRSPQGWVEPGQTPEFDEFTIVLKGTLWVEHAGGTLDVRAGQAVVTHAGEWVRYSTPEDGGAEYIAVCLPAFSMETVHRDE
jgi:ethanolamine utilization protein EutQ